MTLFGIHYHHSLGLPIAGIVSSKETFIKVCKRLPTDWALLVDEQTGELLYPWKKENENHG